MTQQQFLTMNTVSSNKEVALFTDNETGRGGYGQTLEQTAPKSAIISPIHAQFPGRYHRLWRSYSPRPGLQSADRDRSNDYTRTLSRCGADAIPQTIAQPLHLLRKDLSQHSGGRHSRMQLKRNGDRLCILLCPIRCQPRYATRFEKDTGSDV